MTRDSVTVDKPIRDDSTSVRSATAEKSARYNVFYLVDSLDVGGTETQAVELALRMALRGHRVTLGCLKARGPLRARLHGSQVKVEEFHPKGGIDSVGGVRQFFRLSRYLRKGRFDIVHTHDLWSNLLGVPAARLAGVPGIISSRRDLGHLDWYEGKRRVWLRRIQNLSHIVLANATPIRDALIAEDGFAPEKLRVIHNGIDVEKFRCAADRRKLFPQVRADKLVVLVGNMHSVVKGHADVIACAPTIVAKFPAICFVFVGDGEKRTEFEDRVRTLGLNENFVFLGRRDDVPEILACCDIALLPSLAEGLPNAVLEYMAAGLPTIASQAGGNVDLIENGVTGILVPSRSQEALGAALLKLLNDGTLAQKLARNGRRFVEENFSFDKLVHDTENLYAEILQGTARSL